MTPETFIRKHIIDHLVAEGFSVSVAGGGGLTRAFSINAACRSPARKEALLMIAWPALVNGRLGKPRQQSGKLARKKPERVAPLTGCYFDLRR